MDSPLVDIRPVKQVLLVCVTGDRGLCGAYNNNIIKRVSSARLALSDSFYHLQPAAANTHISAALAQCSAQSLLPGPPTV